MESSKVNTDTANRVTPPTSLIDDMAGYSVDFTFAELNNEVELIDLSANVAMTNRTTGIDLTGGIATSAALDHQISFAPAHARKFPTPKTSLHESSIIPDDHYRTLIFSNVRDWEEGADLSRILARVRGGSIESAVMVNTNPWGQGNSALVTFDKAAAAQGYMKQLKDATNGDAGCMGSLYDILGFGTVTLVRTPTFPRTLPLGRFTYQSRHIMVDGLENMFLMSFIVHVAERFAKSPSDFFDEVYVEPWDPQRLTTKTLASLELSNNIDSYQQHCHAVLKTDENERALCRNHRLHLVMYNITDAIKVRDHLTRDFVRLNDHTASLNCLQVWVAPDPCLSVMHDLGTCMEDSPLSGAPLSERPQFVSNTGLVANPVGDHRQRHISLLQLFGFRSGKFFDPESLAQNVIKCFGWQDDFREDFLQGFFDHRGIFRYHPAPHSDWKVPLELRSEGAKIQKAFKHRIEMEMRAREVATVVHAKPGLVDVFTQLDREHRGVTPPAMMPVSTIPPHMRISLGLDQPLLANKVVEVKNNIGEEETGWMLEGMTSNDCIKLTQFLQKMIRLAYEMKSSVYGMLIKADFPNGLGKNTAEFLRKCEEEAMLTQKSGGMMEMQSNQHWINLARDKLKEEAINARKGSPIWFSLREDHAVCFANIVAPNITVPDLMAAKFLRQHMPYEKGEDPELVPDWLTEDSCGQTCALSESSLIDLEGPSSPENGNTSPNTANRYVTPLTSPGRNLDKSTTPEGSEYTWDDELDPASPNDSLLLGCRH